MGQPDPPRGPEFGPQDNPAYYTDPAAPLDYPADYQGPPAPGYPPLPPPVYPPPYPGTAGYPAPPHYPGSYYDPYNPYGPRVPTGTNGKAIAALVCGVAGLPLCACYLASIAAIVLGIIAIAETRRTGQAGTGMAIGGVVLGVLTLLMGVLFVAAGSFGS
jgi:hypothetical protein